MDKRYKTTQCILHVEGMVVTSGSVYYRDEVGKVVVGTQFFIFAIFVLLALFSN